MGKLITYFSNCNKYFKHHHLKPLTTCQKLKFSSQFTFVQRFSLTLLRRFAIFSHVTNFRTPPFLNYSNISSQNNTTPRTIRKLSIIINGSWEFHQLSRILPWKPLSRKLHLSIASRCTETVREKDEMWLVKCVIPTSIQFERILSREIFGNNDKTTQNSIHIPTNIPIAFLWIYFLLYHFFKTRFKWFSQESFILKVPKLIR